jgi:hypothetical protein
MVDISEAGFQKYWRQELSSLKSECHAIMNKYPEADSVVQVHKAFSDIEILARSTPARVGESSQWTTIVNSAEEKTAKFCKVLGGKPLFSTLYGMYKVTLKEQKVVLKVNAQAGQSGAVTKTSWESTAQDDDFQEVKKRKRHISNDTSETAKKSTKSGPISTGVKQTPKAMPTCNFFAPLRTTDMDMETNGAGGSQKIR